MGKIIQYAVKKILVRNGIVICKMCDDAVAQHSKDLCAECYDDFAQIQIDQYWRDMKELCQ